MEEKKIPKRKINFDIEGKVFEATELSVNYLMHSAFDDENNIDLALKDSIGEITDEDLKLFGVDTKQLIYLELLSFTFGNGVTDEDLKQMSDLYSMSIEEIRSLDHASIAQLKGIMLSRKTAERDKEHEKKR